MIRGLVVLMACLLSAGCASTSRRDAPRGAAPAASTTVEPAVEQPAAVEPEAASGVRTKTGTRPGTTAAQPSGTTASAAVEGGPAPGTSGRGFDATTIWIGVTTANDGARAAQASGYKGIDPGNVELDANAVLGDVNARGGLFGRTVKARFRDSRSADQTTDPSADAERACTYFTQDAPVVAVANTLPGMDVDTFYSCLAKAKMPVITSGLRVVDRTFLDAYRPFLYTVASVDWTRFIRVFVARLQALGYFDRWDTVNGAPGSAPVRIGLLHGSLPVNTRVFGSLERALTGRGPVSRYVYDMTTAGTAFATTGNAVLRFREDGVTHVIVDEGVLAIFGTAAEQQRYRPRYAMQTIMYPGAAAANMPPAQMSGAVGAGWVPTADADPPPSTGSAQDACVRLIKDAGEDYSDNPYSLRVAIGLCDDLRLAVGGFAAGRGLEASHLASGYALAGPSFEPAVTFSSGASAESQSVVGAVRDLRYEVSCGCLRYASSTDERV